MVIVSCNNLKCMLIYVDLGSLHVDLMERDDWERGAGGEREMVGSRHTETRKAVQIIAIGIRT